MMNWTSQGSPPSDGASSCSETTSSGPNSFSYKASRGSRQRGRGSTRKHVESTPSRTTSDSASPMQKRRQQVYQAQKRHRDRKAEYLKSLEEEVARLRQLDALVNSQRNLLACQNRAFRQYFAAQPATVLEELLPSSSSNSSALSSLGSASVNIRYDENIDKERTFLDLGDVDEFVMTICNDEQSIVDIRPPNMAQSSNWVALDFILALEWPCRDHHAYEGINYPAISSCVQGAQSADTHDLHGHSMTMTAAVYQSTHPAAYYPIGGSTISLAPSAGLGDPCTAAWYLDDSEIDKLVRMSEQLELDEELTTPAQAYSYVKKMAVSDAHLLACLRAIQPALACAFSCFGFGAVVPTPFFLEQVRLFTHAVIY